MCLFPSAPTSFARPVLQQPLAIHSYKCTVDVLSCWALDRQRGCFRAVALGALMAGGGLYRCRMTPVMYFRMALEGSLCCPDCPRVSTEPTSFYPCPLLHGTVPGLDLEDKPPC